MKKRLTSLIMIMTMLCAFIPCVAHAGMSINIGEYLQMGTYYGEPILWRCVDIDENGPLMLADKILCIKAFDAEPSDNTIIGSHSRSSDRQSHESNYWGDSNMRSWLNSTASAGNIEWICGNPPVVEQLWGSGYNPYDKEAGFMSNFKQIERHAIKSVSQKSLLSYPEIDAGMAEIGTERHEYEYNIEDVLANYDTAYAEYVTDKMFLMDVKQVNAVYNNSNILGEDYYIGEPTATCVANSEYKDDGKLEAGKKWRYWLRSPSSDSGDRVRYVEKGSGGVNGLSAIGYYIGVRPAFYLNLSSSIKSGSGTEVNPYIIDGGKEESTSTSIKDVIHTDDVISNHYGAKKFKYTPEGRVYSAATEFNKAMEEYLSVVKKETKKISNSDITIEDKGRLLMEAEETSKYKYITFKTTPPDKAKLAAYEALAIYFETLINKGSAEFEVDIEDPAYMIDAKLTKQIISNFGNYSVSEKYEGYTVSINAVSYMKVGTANMTIKKGNTTYSAIYVSKPEEVAEAMNELLSGLRNITDDITKQAAASLLAEIINITGFDNWIQAEVEYHVSNATKTLRKHGFGNILKTFKKCSDGYETVKGIIAFSDTSNIQRSLANAQDIYSKLSQLDYSDSAVDNFVIEQALNKINNAKEKLIDELYSYIYQTTGETPKEPNFFDNFTSWITSIFQCPVEFTVYDNNNNVIGYVDDGMVYYSDDIYIETSGDVKKLYVPQDMQVQIEMKGTDEDEFNYVLEEVVDGEPTGRLNYYAIPLTDGAEFTQNLDSNTFSDNTEDLPIVSQDGNINADEYLSADDMTAFVTVETECGNEGVVIGAGDYAKGDSVELTALVSDDKYVLSGWYVNDELVSTDGVYRFTAIENVTVRAEFTRKYAVDYDYKTEMSDAYDDFYAYVYENSDGSQGIVIMPFVEDCADSMQICCTSYGADGVVLNDSAIYSAELSDKGLYDFENIDFTGVSSVIIESSDGEVITTLSYDVDNSEDGIKINTLGKYRDSAEVTSYETDGFVTVDFYMLDDTIETNDIDGYIAEYDEYGNLFKCRSLLMTETENGVKFTGNVEADYKIFIWDSVQCPLIEPISNNMM